MRLLFQLPLMSGVLEFKNVVVRVGAKLYDEPVDNTEDDDDDDDGVGVGGVDHGDDEGDRDGDGGIVGGISGKK